MARQYQTPAMKSFCTSLVLLLVFVSCKKDAAPVSAASYPAISVGIEEDGAFKVVNQNVLKREWEAQLRAEGESVTISGFEIIKGIAKGDSAVDYYMLMATCADHKTTMAALLERKHDAFYFMKDISSVICSGGCAHGCLPAVFSKKNTLYLICSDCADCVKTDFFLNFP